MSPSTQSLRPAVFFDRDGTLMEEVNYCRHPDDVKVFPGVPEALEKLKQAGFLIFVVTNQSGIGRGYFTTQEYLSVEAELLRQLGPCVDGVYFSPDAPGQPSLTRKPSPGLVFEAAERHAVDLPRSYFVGDKTSDILCGKQAGMRTVLVLSGYGSSNRDAQPDLIARDVAEAVDRIVAGRPSAPG